MTLLLGMLDPETTQYRNMSIRNRHTDEWGFDSKWCIPVAVRQSCFDTELQARKCPEIVGHQRISYAQRIHPSRKGTVTSNLDEVRELSGRERNWRALPLQPLSPKNQC